ncbi:DUF1190 domain-containing protein [Cellvibrio japonicus]|uniref:Putative lipoprotein n=1 Tax=Cellvibrio japonicus (strain Ueda107) TaxID=498211 RepID=B3PBJ8_CELJU|nr:DUF1190 domain-containing protein [Cellvibrio japonicus]ACE85998.1 putative lipoprotein [Cellvibrio japonicus Ueda107]QEI13111.1 DUF1190 domain-containing protein [Cellvibrio japonicus]QEI16685.1 DUF1190 domain-containing protein [Cellvibrio japonicus]QEI20263.1 DUF1190 domain-containing protein [Cellvibrio japonicus]
MKRSKKAALVLMVPATTLMLAGCGEDREQSAVVFSSPTECAQSLVVSAEQCESDYTAAQALHPQVAPKYLNKQECEADFGAGQCETAPYQTTSGGSVFMPMMMGFLAGQLMGGANAQNLQARNQRAIPSQPLYKSRDDRSTFRTATNQPVSKGIGPITLRPSQVQPKVGQVVRRGGFGQQAAMRAPATGFGG